MKIISFTFLCLALVFVACTNKVKKAESTGFNMNQSFQLKLNQTIKKNNGSLQLTLTGIPEDSRCPEDANCIWEGQVRMFVDAAYTDKKESIEFKIEKSKMGKVTRNFEKYKILVESVDPPTQSGVRIPKENYVVTMKVSLK